MANRRKDMWKLVYHLVNKKKSDLDDVFASVEDILCKHPSLIRPYSLREISNRFQDAFVLWLINKFIKYSREYTQSGVMVKNIELQKNILSSCLIYRTLLFKRLVEAYINGIAQLSAELPEDYWHDETGKWASTDPKLELKAFNFPDDCLLEIDENFEFADLQVRLVERECYVQALLQVLSHALEIGYEVYPELLISALDSVFSALKECDMPVKWQCLRYCYKLFKKTHTLTGNLEHYCELSVRSLSLMWAQLPVWLHAKYVSAQGVSEFVDVTTSLLEAFMPFIDQLNCRQHLLQLCYSMLGDIAEIHIAEHDKQKVITGLVKFMLELQLSTPELQALLNTPQCLVLLRLAELYPTVLRLLAPFLQHEASAASNSLLKLLKQKILHLLSKPKATRPDLQLCHELLLVLSSVEHQLLQQQQLDALKAGQTIAVVTQTSQNTINLFASIDSSNAKGIACSKLEAFLDNAAQNTAPEFEESATLLNICGRLLQTSSIRHLLSAPILQKIINFLEKPLKTALKPSSRNTSMEQRELACIALQSLCDIPNAMPPEVFSCVQRSIMSTGNQLFASASVSEDIAALRQVYCSALESLIVSGMLTREQIVKNFMTVLKDPQLVPQVLQSVYCTSVPETSHAFRLHSLMAQACRQRTLIVCGRCTEKCQSNEEIASYLKQHRAILLPWPSAVTQALNTSHSISATLKRELCQGLLTNAQLCFVGNHLELCAISADDLMGILTEHQTVANLHLGVLRKVLPVYIAQDPNFLQLLANFVLQQIIKSLDAKSEASQLHILKLISGCVQCSLSEQWLFQFFKMTFFFLLHPDSQVAHEAVLCATEMCALYNLQPNQLWNWYRRDALCLIVKLSVYVYLRKGVRLTRSLKALTKMLGFSCPEEFICKYYRLLTTMLLPYCVQAPDCKGLIVTISKVTRKPIPHIFVVSFLRIYTHIYLTQEAAIANKCIDLIVKCTSYSLKKLLNADVQQTVAEFLIFFNRNPKFVMQAFHSLILHESGSSSLAIRSSTSSNNEFAKFIADRFLGLITHFEKCLADDNFEKPLKEEALYSIGQIIRYVGPGRVTQFRFKIIAMLDFVLSLGDKELQRICLKIWNIFLHIVNIQELGPSLGRIFASLQPLLSEHEAEVNAIYEYVILKNDSLLGAHIADLYFVETIGSVAPAIRQCVARHTEILKSENSSLLDKLGFLYRQISNENLQVRIYGLEHLRDFIAREREGINHMFLNEIRLDPLIENVVDILVAGCRHDDRKLQLASAKCLGELGAIDPSYMPTNFIFEQSNELPLGILTDDFAIMALTELCRFHQFEKDTKYVDNFSLAIQETLSVFGISPKNNKKMNIWNAIPERMRQVMEPLLNSCYAGSRRENKYKEHPIFNSSCCRSYEEWSFIWASRLIDCVHHEDTKQLLNAYKPSLKRDSNALALFFPYILLHAVQESTDVQRQHMYEEFEAVISCSSLGVVSQPVYETTGSKEFLSTKYSANSGADSNRKASGEFEALEKMSRTCMKLCSEQLDFLRRWAREWQRINIVGGKVHEADESFKRVTAFNEKFDKLDIARANYNTGDFARALKYLEEYIEVDPEERLQAQISFLIELHGSLKDADSVEGGVYVKKSNLTLEEEILVNRIVDRPQETMTCYEQLMSSNDEHITQDHIKGMINCYLRMDAPELAVLITDGLWQKLSDQYTDDYFKECKSELLWRLGRYDELQELLEDSVVRRKTANWNIQCAEAFLLFRQPVVTPQAEHFVRFVAELDVIRSNVLCTMRSCSSVNQSSYPHVYDEVVKLHLLNEVEKTKSLLSFVTQHLTEGGSSQLSQSECLEQVTMFFADWNARLVLLQPVVRVVEPVLCFRRNLLIETKRLLAQHFESGLLKQVDESIDSEVGKLWICSAQLNRDAGCLQQAHLSIMKAEEYAPKTLFIEKTKLLWVKGDQSNTFKLIEEHLERIETSCGRNINTLSTVDRTLYAEAKYLQATYSAESMNICAELNLRYFVEAIACNGQSEQCHVQYAQYCEKIHASYSKEQREDDNGQSMLFQVVLNYAKSLRCGHEHVYQSLPQLLTIWLDYTAQAAALFDAASNSPALSIKASRIAPYAKKMNELLLGCAEKLPTSIFYTAFSQLLSRICHPSEDVFKVLRTIFIKLVAHFPHQSLWMMLPILKSSLNNRRKRCSQIFADSRLAQPEFQKRLSDFNMVAERLIELANKDLGMEQSCRLSEQVRQLPRMFEDPKFSEILLPFEKYMQASFPIASSTVSLNSNLMLATQANTLNVPNIPTNPFPYKQIFICSINEQITILRSAAKPKKVTIKCSDGKSYDVMLKPKDDLRKDFRLMEFNGLVKRYLHQDSQARHRRLRIRTYAAIPFNEECGLVEWLPGLNSFRNICNSIYRTRGLGINERALRQYLLPKTVPIEKKRECFTEKLLTRHPPVFQEWFRQRFPTPHSWYEARTAYVKTIAVMSMVGYILGLGDRHGENVLFDESNGDAVHVDFNCLFNLGETFNYPELVPFRLTHNMVFAMGPLGVEGMYRKCCEITLRLLKQESKTLMSVLRPFVYDLAQNRPKSTAKQPAITEVTDPKAMIDVKRIEERLEGYIKKTLGHTMPLSTEGQVNFLIKQATDLDNLAAMYIGWGAFL